MPTDIFLTYAGLCFGGLAIGFFYYGGLWMTFQRIRSSGWTEFLTVASFLVRTLVAAGAFLWLMRGDMNRLLAMLVGFMTARFIMTRYFEADESISWRSFMLDNDTS